MATPVPPRCWPTRRWAWRGRRVSRGCSRRPSPDGSTARGPPTGHGGGRRCERAAGACAGPLDVPGLALHARVRRAQAHLVLADTAASDADVAAAWDLAEELRLPVYRVQLIQLQGMRAVLAGELDLADDLYAQARALHETVEMHISALTDMTSLFMLRVEQGRAGELLRPSATRLVTPAPRRCCSPFGDPSSRRPGRGASAGPGARCPGPGSPLVELGGVDVLPGTPRRGARGGRRGVTPRRGAEHPWLAMWPCTAASPRWVP